MLSDLSVCMPNRVDGRIKSDHDGTEVDSLMFAFRSEGEREPSHAIALATCSDIAQTARMRYRPQMQTTPAAPTSHVTIELEPAVADALTTRARSEGQSVSATAQAILAEALGVQGGDAVDPTVMALLDHSIERFRPLYERLAR